MCWGEEWAGADKKLVITANHRNPKEFHGSSKAGAPRAMVVGFPHTQACGIGRAPRALNIGAIGAIGASGGAISASESSAAAGLPSTATKRRGGTTIGSMYEHVASARALRPM